MIRSVSGSVVVFIKRRAGGEKRDVSQRHVSSTWRSGALFRGLRKRIAAAGDQAFERKNGGRNAEVTLSPERS